MFLATIEKASSDGQITYYKNLEAAIRTHVNNHPSEFGHGRKKKREKRSGKPRKTRSEQVYEVPSEELKRRSMAKAPEGSSHATLYRALEDSISGMATLSANILRFLIDHVGIPSSAQVTFFFFGLLVLTNVFLLKKMSIVDKQLSELAIVQSSHIIGISAMDLEQERELLWQWLRSKEQGKTKQQLFAAKNWNRQTLEVLRQKALLDQQILGIQAVIRGAEDQLDTMRSLTSKKNP
jgi:hypothetical protein